MSHITPRKSLSKAYLKSKVLREEIEQFKDSFKTLSVKVKPDMLEEQLKNDMRDFLLDAYYKGLYEINVKDRKDLVIHAGPKSSDNVAK
jgi:adenine-specific DNA-methyltransferase